MPRAISDQSRFKQNRGKIDLNHPENYIPWIKVRDCFRGKGTRHAFPDIYYKNRIIHVMSSLEKDIYFLLRSRKDVIELFEQYPLLPLSKTEELCEKNNIKHPQDPLTKTNIVMTTDFLYIIKDFSGKTKWQACAVKMSEDLNDIRTREKLFIEKLYWESMGVQWGKLTELQVDKNYVKNVILCKSGYIGWGNGTLYDIVKYLIVQKIIEVDMYSHIDLDDVINKIRKGDIIIGRPALLNEKR
ncbi:MAG: TnsA endonuclease N-terminal domain-containing protein [Syntrophomonadaceae bacterium]|nr:TnsA endonuclease N-terminal domain-containing protein [Syntrophomonadaceae bacterium]